MSVELCGMANRVPDPFRARKELDEVPSPQGPPHSRLRRAVQPSCQAQALLIGRTKTCSGRVPSCTIML